MNQQTTTRLNFIDWMKVIGIYLIIAGHLSPPGNEYVYQFSVPLFFIVSGYMTRVESSHREFWAKLWNKLVKPTLILFPFSLLSKTWLFIKGPVNLDFIVTNCVSAIWGGQNALGTLWFVYTLLIIKVLFQYCRKPVALFFVNMVCVIVCVVMAKFEIQAQNAILNVAPSLPFASIGFCLRRYKDTINSFRCRPVHGLYAVLCALVVFVCYKLNDVPWLYKNGYGNDYAMCVVGGVAGFALIYIVSKFLERWTSKYLVLLSNGTLVILALHILLVIMVRFLPVDFGFWHYLTALTILMAFIPVLLFCKRFIPVLAR